ncbi:unnamed protein product [Peniophora sp. CBMAI 1063]|nr:unnamed protein product [Peniophora sp. CBMAI 1063]
MASVNPSANMPRLYYRDQTSGALNSISTSEQLEDIAQGFWDIITYRTFPLLLESMLFALYTALMIFYCLRFYRRDTQRVWALFAISAGLYILSTLAWALDVSTLWLDAYQLFSGRLLQTASDASVDRTIGRLTGIFKAHDACEIIIISLSDIVSSWRAYVIYNKPMWLKIVSVVVVSFSTGLYIVNETMIHARFSSSSAMTVTRTFWVPYWDIDGGRLAIAVQALTMSATASAQVLATGLIARKAWIHRRQLKELVPDRHDSPRHQRLLAVLHIITETGVVYACLRVLYVLANFGTHSAILGQSAYYWVNAFMSQISGMYPTLIVFMVSVQQSFLERSILNASSELGRISMRLALGSIDAGFPRTGSEWSTDTEQSLSGSEVQACGELLVFRNELCKKTPRRRLRMLDMWCLVGQWTYDRFVDAKAIPEFKGAWSMSSRHLGEVGSATGIGMVRTQGLSCYGNCTYASSLATSIFAE